MDHEQIEGELARCPVITRLCYSTVLWTRHTLCTHHHGDLAEIADGVLELVRVVRDDNPHIDMSAVATPIAQLAMTVNVDADHPAPDNEAVGVVEPAQGNDQDGEQGGGRGDGHSFIIGHVEDSARFSNLCADIRRAFQEPVVPGDIGAALPILCLTALRDTLNRFCSGCHPQQFAMIEATTDRAKLAASNGIDFAPAAAHVAKLTIIASMGARNDVAGLRDCCSAIDAALLH